MEWIYLYIGFILFNFYLAFYNDYYYCRRNFFRNPAMSAFISMCIVIVFPLIWLGFLCEGDLVDLYQETILDKNFYNHLRYLVYFLPVLSLGVLWMM